MSEETLDDVVLKISSNKEPGYAKDVAGAISWRIREKGICKVRAVKMTAVNTAIKAVAIVNQWVAPAGIVLLVDPFFSNTEDANSTAIEMTIREAPQEKPIDIVEYKVSGKQDANETDAATKLAGAIAAPVRASKLIRLRCIGPGAVYKGVYASTIAKGYIYPNNMEAIIIPTWTSMPSYNDANTQISLIQFEFWGINMKEQGCPLKSTG